MSLLMDQGGFRSGKQLGMWCHHLPFPLLSPTHGIFAARGVYRQKRSVLHLAEEHKRSCSWRQPALLQAGQQAARGGGTGWLEMRMPGGMWWVLRAPGQEKSQAPWHLSAGSRLCRVMAMLFRLVSSLGITLQCPHHDSNDFSCDLDSAYHKGHFHFHASKLFAIRRAPARQVG